MLFVTDGGDGDTGVFCHIAPFMLYNIPHSCGPHINVCCQYDFSRDQCWRWGEYKAADPITNKNVEIRFVFADASANLITE